MPKIPPELCARCKGYKRLCGLPTCPILDQFRAQIRATLRVEGRRVEGATPPGLLVGEHGYPKLSIYILVPPGVTGGQAKIYDDPEGWASRRLTLARIIGLRASSLAGRIQARADSPFKLYESEIGLAALSQAPVDTETLLRKPPIPRLRFNGITKPMGPTAPLERVRVESNPKPHPRVEKAVWDDAPASVIVGELYRSGVDIYTIQRAFSLGFLGRVKMRRLVPTRWSITAVDEIVSSHLRAQLRDAPEISGPEAYYGEYLGNKFIIALLPGPGSIEWIEVWHPRTVWTRHSRRPVIYYLYEDPLGRKTAEDGGYSAAKVAVLEALARRWRRADVVIIREILPSYYAPVGNWHIRETVRRALSKEPDLRPGSLEELISWISSQLEATPHLILARSRLLGVGRRMTRLDEYFSL
ncbi:MAG: Nre family DNA repair protein [Desulfurococcales archaeon]|nr:Nre family DNA repair protein [Desulfurococcales archaeon]